jgi:iron complex outermembrane receptor protein
MTNSAYAGEVAMESFFGRFIYSYKDYVTVTHTSRMDGSSKFGAGKKREYFPSFALAWKVTSHDFMKSIGFINFLKLRLGYGETGNDNLDPTNSARLRQVEVAFGEPLSCL